MASFDYEALDPSGRTRKGTLIADSARAARHALKAMDLTPVDIREATARTTRHKSGARMPKGALPATTRQLAMLIRSGTPVEETLRLLAAQATNPKAKRALIQVQAGVVEGEPLATALGRGGPAFTPLYKSVVAAGEASANLGSVLDRLADYLDRSSAMRRKITGALAYPLVLAIVALLVVTGLLVFIVPRVVRQLDTLGQDLPPLTASVMAIADFLVQHGHWLALGVLAVLAGVLIARRSDPWQLATGRLTLSLPVIGRLVRSVESARFARTASTLIAGGAPALSAIQAAANTVKNRVMREGVQAVARRVREGSTVSAALTQVGVCPPLLVHLAGSGERGSELDRMLEKSAEYLEADFEATTGIVTNLLEPGVIILMGAIVVVIVLAIMLPILRINAAIAF